MLKKRNVQVYNTVLLTIAALDPHEIYSSYNWKFVPYDHLHQFHPHPHPLSLETTHLFFVSMSLGYLLRFHI